MINPNDNEIEDLMIDKEDGWREIVGQGMVSPAGTVFSKDGEPLYTLVEDDLFDDEDFLTLD